MTRPELKARPAGYDYRLELLSRFGATHMCEISAVGYGSGDQRKPYQVIEGVALVNITGVLVCEAWYWDETEYSQIRRECEMAANDPEVNGILLRVNSPGGETTMAFETARALADCAKKKPMWAIAEPHAYSAAYLLAAQAERIFVPPVTGGVGSIGVYSMHVDYSGALEKAGIKVTFIAEGKGKVDGNPYEPLSETAQARIRAEVSRLYEEFVSEVADGRGMTGEQIKKLGAVTKSAGDAIAAKLADATGISEDAWFALANEAQSSSTSVAASATTSSKEAPEMAATESAADAKTTAEQDVSKLVAQAKDDGFCAAAEIVEICTLAGKPEMAVQFISERKSAKDVRSALLASRAAESDKAQISNATTAKTGTDTDDKSGDALMAAVEAMNKGGK